MKKRYFKFVEIDKDTVNEFLNKHTALKPFINSNKPFYVRISLKLYPALTHGILCQNVDNKQANVSTTLFATYLKDKITPRRVNKLSDEQLLTITSNQSKAQLIRKITNDVLSRKLKLKKIVKLPSQQIINLLSEYDGLTLNTIKQFCLFSCFKQDILCKEDPDFIDGLKIYLNKKDINKQDIINIEQEFLGQHTLFSLCMWRIKNERNK